MNTGWLGLAAIAVTFAVNGCCGSKEAGKDSSPTAQADRGVQPAQAAQGASYVVGDRIQVMWKGKLYPAAVTAVMPNNQVKIHYEGYGNEWDEVVGPDRIKGRTGGTTPQPVATPQPAAHVADPNQMAADGLPVEIPEPGSKPPTVAEWNSVTREVRVAGSTPRNCETKMLREWLRVSCRQADGSLPPSNVKTLSSDGQQAFVGMFGTTASAVVQVIRGKSYRALYGWGTGASAVASTLVVNWPAGVARPTIAFQ